MLIMITYMLNKLIYKSCSLPSIVNNIGNTKLGYHGQNLLFVVTLIVLNHDSESVRTQLCTSILLPNLLKLSGKRRQVALSLTVVYLILIDI